MPTCIDCGVDKPLEEFYEHPRMASGHLNKCKPCCRYAARRYRGENIEKVHAYDRERSRSPERKAQQARCEIRARERDGGLKKAARAAVYRALKSGRLLRTACRYCGSRKVQAHHADYSKPLNVEWLCFRCHREHAHGQTVTARQMATVF